MTEDCSNTVLATSLGCTTMLKEENKTFDGVMVWIRRLCRLMSYNKHNCLVNVNDIESLKESESI